MKKKLLRNTFTCLFFLCFTALYAQTFTFSTDLEGWSTAYGAQGSNSGTVSHDATGGENGDGALVLARTTNNSNFGLKPANIEASKINYIRMKFKNLSKGTQFRVQGKNGDDVALGKKIFTIDPEKDEWITIFMKVDDISDWTGNIPDLDILVRQGYADGEGNIIIDEVEFIEFNGTATTNGFISNPGFEDGLGDDATWKPASKSYVNTAINRDAANVRTGNQSFKIEYVENPADAVATYFVFNDEKINYGTGELYSVGSVLEAKVWVKSNIATDYQISVTFVLRDDISNPSAGNADDAKIAVTSTVTGSNGNWVELTFSHTISETDVMPDGDQDDTNNIVAQFNKIGLWFSIPNTETTLAYPNTIYFDDFSSSFNGTVLSTTSNTLEGVTVYPNPTSGKLYVNTIEGAKVEIYNILGAKVLSKESSSKRIKLNTSLLNTGIYLLKVSSNGKFHSQKIIVR